MDRIAVSGTVDAGSIPAWSAKVITLCDTYGQVLGGQIMPACGTNIAKGYLL